MLNKLKVILVYGFIDNLSIIFYSGLRKSLMNPIIYADDNNYYFIFSVK